jgi:hypothetical protein
MANSSRVTKHTGSDSEPMWPKSRDGYGLARRAVLQE